MNYLYIIADLRRFANTVLLNFKMHKSKFNTLYIDTQNVLMFNILALEV